MNQKIFQIKNGNLFFRKVQALNNLNLTIKKGEKVAIIGHNGAGKSTTIDVLAGIKKLSSGNFYIIGKNMSFKEKMGIQFQTKNFPPGLKFKSLLKFYLHVYDIEKDSPRIIKLLEDFKLVGLQNCFLNRMSGGQQQKVNIVLALINNPEILFLDEIMTALDITSQNIVLKLIVNYVKKNPNLTIILASHNEQEINAIANRLIVMKGGSLIEDTTPKIIIKKYGSIAKYMEKF